MIKIASVGMGDRCDLIDLLLSLFTLSFYIGGITPGFWLIYVVITCCLLVVAKC